MSRGVWRVLSVVSDAVAVNAAILIAFAIRFGWPPPQENFAAYLRVFVPFTLLQLAIFFALDMYDPTAARSGGPELFGTVLEGVGLGSLVLVATSFFLRALAFPRTVIAIAFVVGVLLVWGWRRVASGVLHIHWPERRVLLVGSVEDARGLIERLEGLEKWGYHLVGVVCDGCETGVDAEGVEWLEGVASLPAYLDRLRPDQIIVTAPARHRKILEEITLSHRFAGEVFVIPQLYEIHLGEVNFSLLSDVPLLRLTPPARPPWQQGAKLTVERVSAVLLLVLLSPVFLLVALAVLFTSGLPVFYLQERLGKDLEPFTVYKFRTMVRDAEREGPVLASERDPRVTPVGRLLRVTRLDEFPQLINIAKGEMSFVGPRPERAAFVEQFVREDPLYVERFRVRPGLTGLAQVSGSYATTPSIKLLFDLMYVYHQSMSLDLRILFRTVQVVLTGRGAR